MSTVLVISGTDFLFSLLLFNVELNDLSNQKWTVQFLYVQTDEIIASSW